MGKRIKGAKRTVRVWNLAPVQSSQIGIARRRLKERRAPPRYLVARAGTRTAVGGLQTNEN